MKRLRAGGRVVAGAARRAAELALAAIGGTPSAAEAGGLLLVAGGLWLIWPPLALIVGGVGCVLWAQGARSEEQDE